MLAAVCVVALGAVSCQEQIGESESTSNVGPNANLPETAATTATMQTAETLTSSGDFVAAYGINNMVNAIDYCLIANDGQMECYTFSGFGATANSNATTEQWLHYKYQVPDSNMEKLRQLLNEAKIAALAKEYHGNIADGTQQYLAIYLTDKPKIVYFDNKIPSSAAELISFLEALMKDATTSGTSKAVTPSEARQHSPFIAYY